MNANDEKDIKDVKNVEDESAVNDTPGYESVNQVAVGKFIKKLRKSHNLTQNQLAAKIFISRKTISKWETGEGLPSVDLLKPLSDVLCISLDELLKGDFIETSNANSGKGKDNNFKAKIVITISIVISLFVIVCLLILNRSDINKYLINYESETISITNGEIEFAKNNCTISFTDFKSDMLKERKFSFKFYSGKEDDLSIENDILSFTGMRQRYNEKETCNALMNAIKHKNGENLFLKVIYFDENGEESHQRLDLKNSITRDLSNTKVRTDDLDSNYEIGISFDIVTNDEDNSVRGSINVKFIFDLSPRELKEKYHGKEITVDGETYKIEYDTENHSLIIKGEYGALVFDFFLRRIKVNFDTQFTLLLDEESNIEFQGEEVKFYNLIKTFIEKLSVL